MTKPVLIAALAAVALAVGAVPAAATSPAQACGPENLFPRTIVVDGQTITRLLPVATRGGCASSWATDGLSVAGVVGQCKRLEDRGIVSYPFTFYGRWTAENRAGCVKILHGLAHGELDSGGVPFPL